MLYIAFIFCLSRNKREIWVPNRNCTLPFLPKMSLLWVISCKMVHVGKVKRYRLFGQIPRLLFLVSGRLKMPVIPVMSCGLPVGQLVIAFFFLKTWFFPPFLGIPRKWWATNPKDWSPPRDALLRGRWGGHHLWIHFCYWCGQWWFETDVSDCSRTSARGSEKSWSHSGTVLSGRCYLRGCDIQTHR